MIQKILPIVLAISALVVPTSCNHLLKKSSMETGQENSRSIPPSENAHSGESFSSDSERFGAKYANLVFLDKLTKKFSLPNTDFIASVPEFFGISHGRMIMFILDNLAYEEIENDWGVLQASARDMKNNNWVSQNFIESAKKIEDRLASSFDIYKPKFSRMNMEWLLGCENLERAEKIAKNGENTRFMVRSTGREDSKELANAGGNESVANVNILDPNDFYEAIKRVVCSYISSKSLGQRAAAKDPNFGEDSIFFPVLVQKMIGESEGNTDPKNIPTSGVLFTTDPFGEKLQKNIGITLIQSTFGHNEAVVNSTHCIAADTYRINSRRDVYPVILEKNARLRPQTGHGLLKTDNLGFESESSLTKKQLLFLKNFADCLYRESNNVHQDVEFIFEGKNLYLVQTRPITNLESNQKSTYLPKDSFKELTIGETLISNSSEVLKIESPHEVIFAKNLGEALAIYEKNEKEGKPKFKLVISEKTSPITSHEATQFRAVGVSVIISSNCKSDFIKNISPEKPLYACMQQGHFGFLEENVLPQEGLIAYPMQVGLSLDKMMFADSPNENTDDLLFLTVWWRSLRFREKYSSEKISFKDWLALEANNPDKKLSLKSIVRPFLRKSLIEKNPYLAYKFLEIGIELHHLLGTPNENLGKILFMQKNLESLYVQRNSKIVDGESLYSLTAQQIFHNTAERIFEKNLSTEQPKEIELLYKLGTRAVNRIVQHKWRNFVDYLVRREKIEEFDTLVNQLGDFFFPWMNSVFASANVEDFDRVLEFMTQERLELAKEYKKFRQEIESIFELESKTPGENVGKWQRVIENLFSKFIEPAYDTKIDSTKIFERYLAKQLLYKSIDYLDLATKKIQIAAKPDQYDRAKEYISTSLSILEKLTKITVIEKSFIIDKAYRSNCMALATNLSQKLKQKLFESWRMTRNISNFTNTGNLDLINNIGDLFTSTHQSLLRAYSLVSGLDNEVIQLSELSSIVRESIINNLNIVNTEHMDDPDYNRPISLQNGAYLPDGIYQETFNIRLNSHSAILTLTVKENDIFAYILIPNGGGTAESRMLQVVAFLELMKGLYTNVQVSLDYSGKVGRTRQYIKGFDGFSVKVQFNKAASVEQNRELLENFCYIIGGAISSINKIPGGRDSVPIGTLANAPKVHREDMKAIESWANKFKSTFYLSSPNERLKAYIYHYFYGGLGLEDISTTFHNTLELEKYFFFCCFFHPTSTLKEREDQAIDIFQKLIDPSLLGFCHSLNEKVFRNYNKYALDDDSIIKSHNFQKANVFVNFYLSLNEYEFSEMTTTIVRNIGAIQKKHFIKNMCENNLPNVDGQKRLAYAIAFS